MFVSDFKLQWHVLYIEQLCHPHDAACVRLKLGLLFQPA